jgi:hypothetical protein
VGEEARLVRRVYPHFVKMRDKVVSVSLPGDSTVVCAQRRADWISREMHQSLTEGERWSKLEGVARQDREVWGVTPEVEFLISHGLGIAKQPPLTCSISLPPSSSDASPC